jgi:hypothetical protein
VQYTFLRIIATLLLFFAVLDFPYGYYVFLRFFVCGVAGYGAFFAAERRRQFWVWVLGGIAVLFNPIFPIHMDKETWAVFDVIAGILVLISVFYLKEK